MCTVYSMGLCIPLLAIWGCLVSDCSVFDCGLCLRQYLYFSVNVTWQILSSSSSHSIDVNSNRTKCLLRYFHHVDDNICSLHSCTNHSWRLCWFICIITLFCLHFPWSIQSIDFPSLFFPLILCHSNYNHTYIVHVNVKTIVVWSCSWRTYERRKCTLKKKSDTFGCRRCNYICLLLVSYSNCTCTQELW